MKILLLPVTVLLLISSCKNKKSVGTPEDNYSGNTNEVIKTNEKPALIENETSLVGKWIVIDGDFSEEMTKEEREEIVGKASVEFFADGKFAAISPEDNDNDKGTYTFDAKANKLTINSEEDNIQVFSITWIGGNLKMTGKEGSMTLKRSGN